MEFRVSHIENSEPDLAQTQPSADGGTGGGRAVGWVRVFALILSLDMLAATQAEAQTLSTKAFLASPAAKAYLDKRYEEALRLLDGLAAQYSKDATILRVKGMALFRLKRYGQAAKQFQRVVALDPNNAAARFWHGAALYTIGDISNAYNIFQKAVSLAPDSAYGIQSAKYIGVMDKKTKDAKRPSVVFSSGVQFDDNVSLVNGTPIRSFGLFEKVAFRYPLVSIPGWTVAMEGSGYFSQYLSGGVDKFGNKADDYDLMSGKVGVDIRHQTSVFGIPVTPVLNYSFEDTVRGYNRFREIHTLTTSLEVNPDPNKLIRVYYRFNRDSFADDGFKPDISSRDGVRHQGGLEGYLYFNKKRHYVWAAYHHTWTDTEGVNFDSRANTVSAGFSASLSDKLVLSSHAEYAHTRYVNFLGPKRRRSAKLTLGGQLTQAIDDNLSISVGYSHIFDNSNYSDLETVQNLATFSIKYKLWED